MTAVVLPKIQLSEGDRVIYHNPISKDWSVRGVVVGFYEDDRAVVETDGGHIWALKIVDLEPESLRNV